MEAVLDVYQETDDARHPLIGMDEASRQILSDLFEPLPMKPDRPKRVDDKYERHGVRALFLFYNPVDGWRRVGCRESRTRQDWAEEVRRLLDEDYPAAETVTLVCDNLHTHDYASLYHAFDTETAGRLRRRLRLVFTPKNGSWLTAVESTCGRDGTQRAVPAMPRSATLRDDPATRHGRRRWGIQPQYPPPWNQLAIHHRRRQNQTQIPIPKA